MKSYKLFTDEECKEVIKFLENRNKWDYIRRSEPNDELYAEYYVSKFIENDFVSEKFKTYIKKEFSFDVNVANVAALKYLPNFKFGRHIDRSYHLEFNKDFLYNINVTLNDDYEGGEFWLDDELFEGNLPGYVYCYNSTQWHEIKPITKGIRYSLLCFVRERDLIIKEKKSLI